MSATIQFDESGWPERLVASSAKAPFDYFGMAAFYIVPPLFTIMIPDKHLILSRFRFNYEYVLFDNATLNQSPMFLLYLWKTQKPTITFMKRPNEQWVCTNNQDSKFDPTNPEVIDYLTECLVCDPFYLSRDIEEITESGDVLTTVVVDFDPYAFNLHQSDSYYRLQEGKDFTSVEMLLESFYDEHATTFKMPDGKLYLIVRGSRISEGISHNPLYCTKFSAIKHMSAFMLLYQSMTFAQHVIKFKTDKRNDKLVYIPVYSTLGYMYATHLNTPTRRSFDIIQFKRNKEGDYEYELDADMPDFNMQWQNDIFFRIKIIQIIEKCIKNRVCHRLFKWKATQQMVYASLFFLSFHYYDETFVDNDTLFNLNGMVQEMIKTHKYFEIENNGIYFQTNRFLAKALLDEFYIFNQKPIYACFTAEQLNITHP